MGPLSAALAVAFGNRVPGIGTANPKKVEMGPSLLAWIHEGLRVAGASGPVRQGHPLLLPETPDDLDPARAIVADAGCGGMLGIRRRSPSLQGAWGALTERERLGIGGVRPDEAPRRLAPVEPPSPVSPPSLLRAGVPALRQKTTLCVAFSVPGPPFDYTWSSTPSQPAAALRTDRRVVHLEVVIEL